LLFRYETRRQTKTNLMVFLRPIVVRDAAGYGAITSERYGQSQEAQRQTKPEPHPVLPDVEPPVLPDLQ
jgi:general secretion pathway protein D